MSEKSDKVYSKEELKQAEDKARDAGQRQALQWVNEILNGLSPAYFGYLTLECAAMKERLQKLMSGK